MRHGKKFNHLGRKPAHRKATLSNMASSLILHKRITTTVAKAKALRKYVEPIITRSKDDTTHSRRMVFRYLQNKDSVKELFGEVAEKVASRPGGYTRIIRTGNRLGDNAEMCIMELVDFNELLIEEAAPKSKTRRGRRRKSSAADSKTESAPAAKTEETPQTDAKVEEVESEAGEQPVEEEPEEVQDMAATEDSDTAEVVETEEETKPEADQTPDETPEQPEAKAEDDTMDSKGEEKPEEGEDKPDEEKK